MSDFRAIAVALAARFAPAQVTPPAGYPNIRASYDAPPNKLTQLPAVCTFLDTGAFDHFPGKRDGVHIWTVRFYFAQYGDVARDTVALESWLTVLADQLKISVQLGGIVTVANVEAYSVGVLNYAGQEYSGIELRVSIVTNEAWAAVA